MIRHKKAPAATEALKHTSDQTNASRQFITARQERALLALLKAPQTTMALRAAVGCSNASDCVIRLRERTGLSIPSAAERVKDRDGKTVIVAQYFLTASDALKVRKWLGA